MPVGERRLLELDELWPQEQVLCAKAAEGGLLDLRCRRPREDEPTRGREWGPQRRIRAQVLFQLLTGHGPELADQVVAVRLRGAQIVGRLNLGTWKLRCSLELNQCHLRYRLDLAKAEVSNLNLRGTYLRAGLFARGLQVTHTLNLRKVQCTGGVRLPLAHIGGTLDCAEAVFSNPDGAAVSADGMAVDAGMFLRKAQCTGEVRLFGAQIKGQLDCDGAVLSNPGGLALNADGLSVDASMFLRKAQCTGEVRLLAAQIKGQLDCDEAVLSNPGGLALNADGLSVDARMFLRKAQCTGEVRLLAAHTAGTLRCSEAVLSNPDGLALNAYGLSVDTDLSLRKAQCTGEVRLFGAQIKGQLECDAGGVQQPRRARPERRRAERRRPYVPAQGAVHRRGAAARRPDQGPAGLRRGGTSATPAGSP